MIKRALIIVPHPDDEINLAGGLFETLHKSGVYTTVVMCTNGDYIPSDVSKRYYETLRTKKIFNYQELIYLGYGDGYEGTHIYDGKENEIVVSHCGNSETYCAGPTEEFCYKRLGFHHQYTRENYKKDIKAVVLEIKADLIICVDLDSHLDHRCISLLFDECMGEILKNERDYKPIILKGFAYNSVWFGPNDFFDITIKPATIELKHGELIERKCFPYNWEDRVRITNSDNVISLKLWKNPIFKALLANKTQCDYYKVGFCALASFPRIANPDSCYWYRSPFNLVLYSDISATSGETKYLNDFMLTRPTRSISDDFSIASLGWSPDLNDKTPSIIIKFPRQVTLKKIVLYQNCSSTLESIRVVLDNGFEEVFQCTNNNVLKLALPSVLTNQLELRIVSYGDSITLNEIECYEEDYLFPWDKLPFKRYEDKGAKRNEVTTSLVKYFYKVFLRFLLIKSKVKSQLRYK